MSFLEKKIQNKKSDKFFFLVEMKNAQGSTVLLFLGEKSPKDLRGDVARWENEGGWETSGEVKLVTLRCKKLPFLNHHH